MDTYTKAKLEEGKRIGKTPWCASGNVEAYLYNYLNPPGDREQYPQETYHEAQLRYVEEGEITQEEYEERMRKDLEFQHWQLRNIADNALKKMKEVGILDEYLSKYYLKDTNDGPS
jgi:ABC-type amino acid transport substrate-binding protein